MVNNKGIEIELKFEILPENQEYLEMSLKGKGFSITQERQLDKNVMFDNLAGLMKITDGRVRVRSKGTHKLLTYKRPLQTEDNTSKQIEYEIEFDDSEGMIEKIFEEMQFTPTTSYERFRTYYEKDGVVLTIDEYPFTTFIEIEGEEEAIKKVAIDLGFHLENAIKEHADTLYQEWRKKRGLGFKAHMKFEDYDK